MDKFFQITKRGSTVSTEIRAGIVTFITMAYILPVNMGMLAAAGLDSGAAFMATALSAFLGTILMGLLAKLPFAQASGMGLNAFFAYTVVLTLGYSPSFALAAVFAEGIIFLILSLTGIRTQLLRVIPKQLRIPIAAGIGLFIMFIGFQNAGFVISNPSTLVEIASDLMQPTVFLFLIGLLLTVVLWLKKVKGALLWGILGGWVIGILTQLAGFYKVLPDAGVYSLIPSGFFSAPPSIMPTLGLCFGGLKEAFASSQSFISFLSVTLTFLYVDIFDTLGTFAGVMTRTKMIDSKGEFPGAGLAFTSDAIATTAGAILGTSTVTTYVESSAGVEEGGRTGLTATTTAILFLLAIPFYPIIAAIPSFATAPALVMVGIMMCSPLAEFEWSNPDVLVPGVVCMITMVIGYSISAGIMWGVLVWLVVQLIRGKASKTPFLLYVLGVLFVLKLFILN